MSLVQAPLPVPISLQPASSPRKRTSSFSYYTGAASASAFTPSPRPAKSQRIASALTPSASPAPTTTMGSPLRRSETMVVIPETPNTGSYRVLQHYKDQRLRRKGPTRATTNVEPITSRPRLEITLPQQRSPSPSAPLTTSSSAAPAAPKPKPRKSTPGSASSTAFSFTPSKPKPTPKPPSQIILPSRSSPTTTLLTHRTSSPLSPMRVPLPGRPIFPRSRPEPDLYRTALKMRMRSTPEGQRMLLMGPRVAMSIMSATAELERIIAESEQQRDGEGDVMMGDSTLTKSVAPSPTSLAMPVLTASWVVVKGEDWEMVDCAA
ncbi:hypothetical protein GALMADRAFT_209168 [Galerina marginata CBS 339.88]|uniref:Uncharacterized protein n=1 Tax=Galerina marginata (strain CBS 339.88) TaxID=685588 RepID=A0A067T6F5_GALM3|nr:hypothetical protein GALMADRAFT_209168 [Galerina marginata CBS 339.88]